MSTAPSLVDRWFFALKPRCWPELLTAAVLGQAIGVAARGDLRVSAWFLGLLSTACAVVAVVLVAAWRARAVDAFEGQLLAEAVPGEAVESLAARSLVLAGAGAGAFAVGWAIVAELSLMRPGLVWSLSACLLVVGVALWLRLHHRGGAEVLEMLAVGFALPWWNAYLQGGNAAPEGLVLLPAHALLVFASALARGVEHETEDMLEGKRTFATMFGADAVRQGVEGLVLAACLVFAAMPWLARGFASPWMMFPSVAVLVSEYRTLRAIGPQGPRYRRQLQRCIWRSILVLAIVVTMLGLAGVGEPIGRAA